MTIDREARSGGGEQEDEQEQEATSGVVYLDWQTHHEGQEAAQRVSNVQQVEVREGMDEYDQGELVLHQDEGTAVFDRNELRGFRAQEGVDVPQYQQRRRGADSSDTGAE